jgi:hypothetical protein
MNDAHAYEMQVQICEPNTWGVTHGPLVDRHICFCHPHRFLWLLGNLLLPGHLLLARLGLIRRQIGGLPFCGARHCCSPNGTTTV